MKKIRLMIAVLAGPLACFAFPAGFRISAEGGIDAGSGIGMELMTYQNWKPTFQKPPALVPLEGYPKSEADRYELKAGWKLLDGFEYRVSEVVEASGPDSVTVSYRLEADRKLNGTLVLNVSIPVAEAGGRVCTVDGETVELPRSEKEFKSRKWNGTKQVSFPLSSRTLILEGDLRFELFSSANAYRLRIYPKRTQNGGETAELSFRLVSQPGGVDAAVGRALSAMDARHPRILLRDFDGIAAAARTPWGEALGKRIVGNADVLLTLPPTERVMQDPLRMSRTSQEIEFRIHTLAVAHVLTGDPRYARRAIDEMLNAAAYPDWNPKHFLDTAELTFAVALGYDWLYDRMTAEERRTIAAAIRDKGILPSFQNSRDMWWVSTTNNWNQICHGGLIAGALAIAELDPELARKTIVRAVVRLQNSVSYSCNPRGAYPEGPGYWVYGMDYATLALDMLDRALGTSFGLAEIPGLAFSGDYMQAMTGPSGLMFNCADIHTYAKRQFSYAMFSLARRFGRPDYLRPWEVGILEQCGRTPSTRIDDEKLLPLVMTCPPVSEKKAVSAPLSYFSGAEAASPIAVMRSDWTPRAVYFGMTVGNPARNHGHMDCGAFLYESDGVRWAMDLGAQNYAKLEKVVTLWDMNQNSSRWSVFRYGMESHNILRFGDRAQLVRNSGKIVEATDRTIVADLTAAYSDSAGEVVRKAELLENRTLLLFDRIAGIRENLPVRWQMCTRAEVEAQPDGSLLLRQNGATLRLEKSVASAWEIVPEKQFLKPYDQETGSVKMLRFAVTPDSWGAVSFSVKFIPGS